MALKLVNVNGYPVGQYDAVDAVTTTVKGGEVGTFTSVTSASDVGAADADGYLYTSTTRPAITTVLPATVAGPLGLIDEGTANYGTLFGSVIGTTAGKGVTGTNLGPHTAAASGKFTFWDKPGTYAVTLDAVDTTFNSGLVPTNTTLTVGARLYAQQAFGLLTPSTSSVVAHVAGGAMAVARFIEFDTNGSLVTTPSSLVTGTPNPTQAVFEFNPPLV